MGGVSLFSFQCWLTYSSYKLVAISAPQPAPFQFLVPKPMCQGPPARRYVPFVRFPGDFTSGRGGCLCTLSWVADLGSLWKYSPASIYLPESTQPCAMDLLGLLKSQFLCHLVFCYVFIASGLIINTVQLFTLLLWPINKQLFRRINCRLSYCVSSQLVMLLEWWSGTECIIHTDPQAYPKYGKENAIVVLNHKFEIDFLCGWSLAERFGVLGGSKVLAKKELAYVPIIGWMWYFTEMVFCTRKWEQDRKTVSQSLLHLRDYPEKYFFLIHCEGTRFTEKKHQISMQVARAKGLPSLKYHLLPRTKGFAVTVRSLRNEPV
ncbi:1-acyl-sn-glycerol-3-phosphate acyltransferase delta isoform X5 [Panthera uncia]|uniref:1-acyl-sn-glycerol-3-phosphate acyltransferase delta isoform X5 n=1 Tax=Panthera uncia TaxID=29064 RepID=UPI0020FF9660|nr:1-acyl-sn-glycerol-3-phosphate acyltransferase delta isoform X5 [Panthera uncia]